MSERIKELLAELEQELGLIDIDGLHEFRADWVNELKSKNHSEWIIDLCTYIVDRAILVKSESTSI